MPTTLPAVLAQPWATVAAALQMPPVLVYATYNLMNWRRLDTSRPIELGNIAVQHVGLLCWWLVWCPACVVCGLHITSGAGSDRPSSSQAAPVLNAAAHVLSILHMHPIARTRPESNPSCSLRRHGADMRCPLCGCACSNSWGAWTRRGSGWCMWPSRQLLRLPSPRCCPCRQPQSRCGHGRGARREGGCSSPHTPGCCCATIGSFGAVTSWLAAEHCAQHLLSWLPACVFAARRCCHGAAPVNNHSWFGVDAAAAGPHG